MEHFTQQMVEGNLVWVVGKFDNQKLYNSYNKSEQVLGIMEMARSETLLNDKLFIDT